MGESMIIQELYELVGGDYSDANQRFLSDEKIIKYLKMLLTDENYPNLKIALETDDYEKAFICSHTIKGILLNLSLKNIADLACDLTEALREKKYNSNIPVLYKSFHDKYEILLSELRKLD